MCEFRYDYFTILVQYHALRSSSCRSRSVDAGSYTFTEYLHEPGPNYGGRGTFHLVSPDRPAESR